MSWKQTLDERKEIVLATASIDGNPNAIIVISMGIMEEKLLIGACVMNKTLENVRSNYRVVIVPKDNGEYYRIKGTASIQTEGDYFDYVYKNSKPPMPKAVIVIDIIEVFDLDKQQIVAV